MQASKMIRRCSGFRFPHFDTRHELWSYVITKIKRLQQNLKFIGNSHLKQSVTNYGMLVSVAVIDNVLLMTQNCQEEML